MKAPGLLPAMRKLAFGGWMVGSVALVVLFIAGPLAQTVASPEWPVFVETLRDSQVLGSIGLSIVAAGLAAAFSVLLGTPLAFLLARREFRGKRLVESLVDLPIMIPHPVVGIALLTVAGRGQWAGEVMQAIGIRLMGTVTGIVAVLAFVGLPFYINTVKAGIEAVPTRLEKVSRSLGAGPAETFFRVTLPLTWRHMLVGVIMCMARAISEFGAVVIVAYHPMIAPVLMYERFTAYGLKYSQPIAVLLICISLAFFLLLRMVSLPRGRRA